jgi:hypothetical protein
MPPDQLVAPAAKRNNPTPGFQWEMVVPKMVRPAKRTGPSGAIAEVPSLRQLPSAKSADSASATAAPQSGPNLYTASTWSRKVIGIYLLGALGALGLTVALWTHRSATTDIDTVMGGAGWTRYVTERRDPGAKQSRQLVLYRPSLGARDGRLEFTWGPSPTGVAWVFRAKDQGNYYAMRLRVVQPGPSPSLSLEHFAVSNFVEGSHTEKILVFSRDDPAIRIRMDVFGPTFTVYIQGTASDYWTDGQLTSGGFGFLEDWNQGADIRSVRMSFPQRTGIPPHRGLRTLQEFFALELPAMQPALGGD